MPKFYDKVNVLKKPEWLKVRLRSDEGSAEVERIVKQHSLHTICSSGLCPNKAECWSRRTATFMILGDICTRGCKFCATKTGKPLAPEASEPRQVAESVRLMGLRHVVVTSVTRDDLPDGGARHWAATVEAIREENPDATIELLIPDLDARADLIEIVTASAPRHNRAQHRNRRATYAACTLPSEVSHESAYTGDDLPKRRGLEEWTDGRTWRER